MICAAGVTYGELQARLIGADAEFLQSQVNAHASIDAAIYNWMTEQARRLEASNKMTRAIRAETAGNDPARRGRCTLVSRGRG